MLLKLLATSKEARKRFFLDRITEPLHLNLISLFVALFGSYRTKIVFDLIIRQHYAFGVLKAADTAKRMDIKEVTIIEFGVGHGAGILKLQKIALNVTKITGIKFKIYGFDIVSGMPETQSYKDLPAHFVKGSYETDLENLRPQLYPNVDLVIGDVTKTIRPWMKTNLSENSPIGL